MSLFDFKQPTVNEIVKECLAIKQFTDNYIEDDPFDFIENHIPEYGEYHIDQSEIYPDSEYVELTCYVKKINNFFRLSQPERDDEFFKNFQDMDYYISHLSGYEGTIKFTKNKLT